MKPCPCIDCLIFPICKAQVDNYIKYYNGISHYDYVVYVYVLKDKCSLIIDWVCCNPTIKCYSIINDLYK